MIRVAIAEDHDLVRQGIVKIINSFKDVKVVLDAPNGKELCDKILEGMEVDVAILDLEMPIMDGYAAAELLSSKTNIKLLALSQHSLDRYIVHFIEKGGVGYLLKNVGAKDLEIAIKQVHVKGYFINDNVSFKMLRGMKKRYKTNPGFGTELLTESEKEVLLYLGLGHSSGEIAELMSKSARTIENHRANMMEKLGAKNSIQLVVTALQRDLLVLEKIL